MNRLALLIALSLPSIALGQSVTSATQNPVQIADHPQHAAQHALGNEQSLLPSGTITYAQGEQPISDFCKEPEPTVSLGQIARELREGRLISRPIIRVIP